MKKFLPLLVFLMVAGLGLSMTAVVYRAEVNAEQRRFEVAATEAVENIRQRLNQHVALLMSTRSLMRANKGLVNGNAFRRFVDGLDIKNKHAGIQGIGYAQYINTGAEFIAEFRIKDNYDIDRKVWPETDQSKRAAIVLLEPDDARNHAALGFDMFSEERRRGAMINAIHSGELRATAPVELVQEITAQKQSGFLLYLPFGRPDTSNQTDNAVEGFVYAPFRAGDLHLSAIEPDKMQTVALRSMDGDIELYRSPDYDPSNADYGVIKKLEIGGRTWDIELHETPYFYQGFAHLSSLVLGALSGILAFALAVATIAQQNAIRQAHEVKRVVEDTLKEKDMLLQEMRHRIKNSIARVLAIARQTGSNSENLEEFQKSFNARLHAMANSQDLLTRSKWARADLHELLSSELQQVFGAELENCTLSGDKVELNETITQAVGLAAHEMATNALKYGGVADPGGRLDVTWEVFGKRKTRTLRLFWEESSPTALKPTDKKGFGTRLIDANITGELGGTIIRRFEDNGLHAEIVIPLGKS
jgi:CHASE1-domain containing sensor protein